MWYLIFWTILVAGLACGIIKFYVELRAESSDAKPEKNKDNKLLVPLISNVGNSLVAAALVPLFLNATSSNIIEKIALAGGITTTSTGAMTGTFNLGVAMGSPPYIVFSSFCVIAAYVQNQFIDRLAVQVFSQIKETKEAAKEAVSTAKDAKAKSEAAEQHAKESSSETQTLKEALVPIQRLLTEPDDEVPTPLEGPQRLSSEISNEEETVWKALGNGSYAFRSAKKLAAETNLSEAAVNDALESLAKSSKAQCHVLEGDITRWSRINL